MSSEFLFVLAIVIGAWLGAMIGLAIVSYMPMPWERREKPDLGLAVKIAKDPSLRYWSEKADARRELKDYVDHHWLGRRFATWRLWKKYKFKYVEVK